MLLKWQSSSWCDPEKTNRKSVSHLRYALFATAPETMKTVPRPYSMGPKSQFIDLFVYLNRRGGDAAPTTVIDNCAINLNLKVICLIIHTVCGSVVRCLPAAVLSCFVKKVPKETTWGGFECIAPAMQATSPRPLQARSPVTANKATGSAQCVQRNSLVHQTTRQQEPVPRPYSMGPKS